MFKNNGKSAMPATSIILVSYNNLRTTTAPCLESIFKKTSGDFEVICVDNCSTDGTREYLMAAAREEARLKPILNETNRGFSGGNNDGIEAARGDVIVLLNNDTVVTKGWLNGLRRVLEKDGSIGLVGPVSNSVGNEQRIDTAGATISEVIDEGERWSAMSEDCMFETDMLSFFCVGARRDVIDRVGLLDEAFGLGYYEDDDYCIRVRQAGYRLVCAEDVFVYHRGGGSFSADSSRQLIKKNLEHLEKKTGSAHTPRHWREKLLDVMRADIKKMEKTGFTPELQHRVENRMRLARKNSPRNLIKKAVFKRGLRWIENAVGRFGSTAARRQTP